MLIPYLCGSYTVSFIFFKGTMDGPCVPTSVGPWPNTATTEKVPKKSAKKSKSKAKKTKTQISEKPEKCEARKEVVTGSVRQSVLVTTEIVGKEVKSFDALECTLPGSSGDLLEEEKPGLCAAGAQLWWQLENENQGSTSIDSDLQKKIDEANALVKKKEEKLLQALELQKEMDSIIALEQNVAGSLSAKVLTDNERKTEVLMTMIEDKEKQEQLLQSATTETINNFFILHDTIQHVKQESDGKLGEQGEGSVSESNQVLREVCQEEAVHVTIPIEQICPSVGIEREIVSEPLAGASLDAGFICVNMEDNQGIQVSAPGSNFMEEISKTSSAWSNQMIESDLQFIPPVTSNGNVLSAQEIENNHSMQVIKTSCTASVTNSMVGSLSATDTDPDSMKTSLFTSDGTDSLETSLLVTSSNVESEVATSTKKKKSKGKKYQRSNTSGKLSEKKSSKAEEAHVTNSSLALDEPPPRPKSPRELAEKKLVVYHISTPELNKSSESARASLIELNLDSVTINNKHREYPKPPPPPPQPPYSPTIAPLENPIVTTVQSTNNTQSETWELETRKAEGNHVTVVEQITQPAESTHDPSQVTLRNQILVEGNLSVPQLTLASPEEDWELYKEEFNSQYVSDQEQPSQDLSPNLHKKKKHDKHRRSLVGKVKDFFHSDSEDDSDNKSGNKEKGNTFKRFSLITSSKRSSKSKSKTPELKPTFSTTTKPAASPKMDTLKSSASTTTTQSKHSSGDSIATGYGGNFAVAGLDDISIDDEDAFNEFGQLSKSRKWTTASSSSSLSEYGKVFDLDLVKKKKPLHESSREVISGKSSSSGRFNKLWRR